MKFLPQKQLIFQGRLKSFGIAEKLQTLPQRSAQLLQKTRSGHLSPLPFLEKIKKIGFTPVLQDYDKRKLAIFNLLNFFQLLTGIIVPIGSLLHHDKLPALAWLVTSLPPSVPILVLWLNSRRHYHIAQVAYFVLYPFATCLVYLSGINLGVELSFILYGILSVFFLQDISQMLFSVGLSMVSYFVLAVVCKTYTYQLATANIFFYFFNQILAIAFIFYGLYLIKRENTGYQQSILQQKEELAANEKLLQNQTQELTEVNAFKNRLFSIIAHDLKSPIYAMKHLFQNMQQYDLPAEEIKGMVPEIVNELTYTTSLMENVLLWTRSQMQSDSVRPQQIDVTGLMTDVMKLLRLQAEAKQIRIKLETDNDTIAAFADKDMVNLIFRNLLSNAIKYTPEKGSITVGAHKDLSGVEVFVKDTGMGINRETLDKINLNNYYTTKGTAGESGTGLGLMLCREFLARNGGKMHIESQPGKGSVFSFTLPPGE